MGESSQRSLIQCKLSWLHLYFRPDCIRTTHEAYQSSLGWRPLAVWHIGLIWCEKQKNTKFVRLTLQDSAQKCWLKGQSTNFTCSSPIMSSLGGFFMTKIRLIVTQLFWNTCRNIDIVCILKSATQNIKNTGAQNRTYCVITMLCSSGKPWALTTCECYLDTKPNLPFKLPSMAMASSSTHTQCKTAKDQLKKHKHADQVSRFPRYHCSCAFTRYAGIRPIPSLQPYRTQRTAAAVEMSMHQLVRRSMWCWWF